MDKRESELIDELMLLADSKDTSEEDTEDTVLSSESDSLEDEHDDSLSGEDIEYFRSLIDNDDSGYDDTLVPSSAHIDDGEEKEDVESSINYIRRLSERSNEDDDIDLEQVVSDQFHSTAHDRVFVPPLDTVLVENVAPDPTPYIRTYDNKNMKKVALLVMLMVAFVILSTLVGFSWMMSQGNASRTTSTNTMNSSMALNSLLQGTSNNNSSPYDSTGSSDETTRTANSVGNTVAGTGSIGSGSMSTIEYKIEATENIHNAAAAFIKNNGEQTTDTAMTLPWTKTEQLNSSIVPQLGVSTVGDGSVTCKIIKDGDEIASQTSSGQDPTVIC